MGRLSITDLSFGDGNEIVTMPKALVAAFLHAKHYDPDAGVTDVMVLPYTNWEGVLGAPRMVTKDELEGIYPSEYVLLVDEQVLISDEEYEACFGNL